MCSADFSSCATSPCFLSSAHSPFQTSSLPVLTCPKCFLVFFFGLTEIFVHLYFQHSTLLLPALAAQGSPTYLHQLLLSSPVLPPHCIPTSLCSPVFLSSLSTDGPHHPLSAHLLKHRHISHRWKSKYMKIGGWRGSVGQDPCLVSFSTLPLAPAVPDKSIKIPLMNSLRIQTPPTGTLNCNP